MLNVPWEQTHSTSSVESCFIVNKQKGASYLIKWTRSTLGGKVTLLAWYFPKSRIGRMKSVGNMAFQISQKSMRALENSHD